MILMIWPSIYSFATLVMVLSLKMGERLYSLIGRQAEPDIYSTYILLSCNTVLFNILTVFAY